MKGNKMSAILAMILMLSARYTNHLIVYKAEVIKLSY